MPSPDRRPRTLFPALHATSSSKLKSPPPPPKGPRGSVVERLSQAANHAKLKVEKRKRKEKLSGKKKAPATQETEEKTEKLGSLQSLTAAIEKKLEKSRRQSISNQNRDAMSEVLRHNQEVRPYNATVKEVAILLTKPLQNDRITIEHANRVRRLVKSMMEDNYRPNVICFVGPQGPGNLVADADASYLFFQELCAAKRVQVHGIDIHLVKGSVEDGALEQISYFLKERCAPLWQLESHKNAGGVKQRLHVHFTLVSSEYELCQLNDIHERSPGRSPLRTLTAWSSRSFETTWTYLYATTILPSEEGTDMTQMFRSKTYRSAQQLIPVLQHIRSVAENREFFQIEAYRVLVAARRSVVNDMELLYHRPKNLRGTVDHELYEEQRIQPKQQAVDVVLEAAVLSLGRCLDLVRPVGRGDGVVQLSDWRLAAVLLEKSISQILLVCDTDQPLDPQEWGKMGDETDHQYCNDSKVQRVRRK